MPDISIVKTPEEIASQKRRTTLLLVLITLFALFGFLAFWFFGPNPKIIVSKQTTHITTPLAADGYPDYHAVLLADMKKGVTPENNGAIPFVRTYWKEISEGLEPEQRDWLLKELGIAEPSPLDAFTPIDTPANRRSALEVLRKRLKPPVEDPNFPFTPEQKDKFKIFFRGPAELAMEDQAVTEFLVQCDLLYRPWTESELPFLANWITENQAVLDRLVQASERKDWYFPLALPSRNRGGFFNSTYSFVAIRDAPRKLQIRSNYFIGIGKYDQAARDAMAIVRLGIKQDQGPFFIDKTMVMAVTSIGYQQLANIAALPDVPIEVLNYMMSELEATRFKCDIAKSVDQGERFFQLDYALSTSSTGLISDWSSYAGEDESQAIAALLAKRLCVDWNQFLQFLNEHCDKLVAIFNLPTYKQQTAAIDELLVNQRSKKVDFDQMKDLLCLLSPQARGSALGRYVIGEGVNSHAISTSKFRNLNDRNITRLAIALAIYRSKNGAYPDSLEQLTPDQFKELPLGAYSQLPFRYRRLINEKEPGYLLYSLGVNGLDDGGSSSEANIHTTGEERFEGIVPNRISMGDQASRQLGDKIPEEADDPAYRIPKVSEPWPWEYVDLGYESGFMPFGF